MELGKGEKAARRCRPLSLKLKRSWAENSKKTSLLICRLRQGDVRVVGLPEGDQVDLGALVGLLGRAHGLAVHGGAQGRGRGPEERHAHQGGHRRRG